MSDDATARSQKAQTVPIASAAAAAAAAEAAAEQPDDGRRLARPFSLRFPPPVLPSFRPSVLPSVRSVRSMIGARHQCQTLIHTRNRNRHRGDACRVFDRHISERVQNT